MGFIEKEIEYLSSNKIDIIHAIIFIPESYAKFNGIVQISHGMCEYVDKYKNFIEFLTNNGYIVCGNDHLGHGKYVERENRGFFADENGYKYLVEDVYKLTKLVKKEYKDLPYFLFGHSMGSFIARCYMYKHGDKIDGFIIMGTGYKNKLVDAGIKLADMIIARKGKMYRSRMLTDMVIGEFNKKFRPNVSKYDWLSSDESMLPWYVSDKIGDFDFTASGYKDLFKLNKNCNLLKNVEKIPKEKNIFLLSGNDDPVGDNGSGVLKVYHDLISTGHVNVFIKLYPNLRHELLNEVSKDDIYMDILCWLNKVKNKL